MKTRVFTASCGTSTGNLTFTLGSDTLSLTPMAAIVRVIGATSVGSTTLERLYCVGYTDGTNEGSISSSDDDGVTTSDSWRSATTTFIKIASASNSFEGTATFSSWGTDEMTINWSVAPSASYIAQITFFYELDEVLVGTTSGLDSADKVITTGWSGGTDIVFGASCNIAINTATDWEATLEGFAHNVDDTDNGVQQACVATTSQDAEGTSVVTAGWSNSKFLDLLYTGGAVRSVTLTTFTSTQFTIDASINFGGDILYMAIQTADDIDVGGGTISAATGTTAETFSTTFKPDGLFWLHSQSSEASGADDVTACGGHASMTATNTGAAGSVGVYKSVSVSTEDNVTTMDTATRADSSAVTTLTGETTDGAFTIDSFDTSGFTIDCSDATANQTGHVWLAFKDSAAAGGISVPVVYHHRQRNF